MALLERLSSPAPEHHAPESSSEPPPDAWKATLAAIFAAAHAAVVAETTAERAQDPTVQRPGGGCLPAADAPSAVAEQPPRIRVLHRETHFQPVLPSTNLSPQSRAHEGAAPVEPTAAGPSAAGPSATGPSAAGPSAEVAAQGGPAPEPPPRLLSDGDTAGLLAFLRAPRAIPAVTAPVEAKSPAAQSPPPAGPLAEADPSPSGRVSPARVLTIQLTPPGSGPLTVSLRLRAGSLHLSVRTRSEAAALQVEEQLRPLSDLLRSEGYEPAVMDVQHAATTRMEPPVAVHTLASGGPTAAAADGRFGGGTAQGRPWERSARSRQKEDETHDAQNGGRRAAADSLYV